MNVKDFHGYTAIDLVQSATICKSLLRAGATNNVNLSCWGRSTVHQVVWENGNVDVINKLFDAGFDIDARDADNETPLMNAIFRGFETAARRLIELGADVNAVNKSSKDSLLHLTTSFSVAGLFSDLVDKGGDYTVLNKNNRNVCHNAARFGTTELVKVITQANLKGLNLSVRDVEGRTPRDYINEHVILRDSEIGIHRAFLDLEASIGAPDSSNPGFPCESFMKLPGSFPDNVEDS